MKTCVLALATVAGFAASASAELVLPANAPLIQATSSMATRIGENVNAGPADATSVYNSIPSPYAAFAAGAFSQFDDYTTTQPANSQFFLDAIRFVGGVANSGGILDFFFLDSAGANIISSFGVGFGTNTGNFIWTITFPPNGANDPLINSAGQLVIQTRTGSTGQWYLTTTAPSPGSNSLLVGSTGGPTNTYYQAFDLQIPAPGSGALLALGGLVATRRRRR